MPTSRAVKRTLKLARYNSEPFGYFKTKEYLESEQRKRSFDKIFVVPKSGSDDPIVLGYHNKSLVRIMPKNSYETWKELFDAGTSVEPIISAKKISGGKIEVSSKIVGHNLNYYVEKNLLSKFQRVSIARQIIEIMLALWKRGVVHRHPHKGNFVVVFEGGHTKVYLIDVAEALRTSNRAMINVDLVGVSKVLEDLLREFNKKYISSYFYNFLRKKIDAHFEQWAFPV